MSRTLFGFILGLIVSYYTLPFIESKYGSLPRLGLGEVFASGRNQHASNILNATAPAELQTTADKQLSTEVMLAIAVTRRRALSDPTSDYVLKLITNLVEKEPAIQSFVQHRLVNGLTNQEALEIFENYYSHQG